MWLRCNKQLATQTMNISKSEHQIANMGLGCDEQSLTIHSNESKHTMNNWPHNNELCSKSKIKLANF